MKIRKSLGRTVWSAILVSFTSHALARSPGVKDSSERILQKEVTVQASLDEVWHAWTTSEGIASFFSPESNIELRIGGPYELYMGKITDASGKRGTEGCRILSYVPREMLSFEWNFPPKVMKLRKSGSKTHVVLRFEDLGENRVRVRFAQLGWKEGEDWDTGYAYFDKAWDGVLDQLKDKAKADRLPSADGETRGSETRTWVDGNVTVTAVSGPEKRQDFEMLIPIPVTKVWKALATTEGIRECLAPKAEIELKPGGTYAIWPGSSNRVLSYLTHRMLSTSGSAPPQFPNVRKGGTWSAYFFEQLGEKKTKLRLTVVGWKQGEEWDRAFDYFLKNNPVFLNHLYKKLAGNGAAQAKAMQKKEDVLRQEVEIDAPLEAVWHAFTTKEGVESWMVPLAEIDLRVGGKMRTNYNRNGAIGDASTIESTIIGLEPKRMLSLKLTKPPKGFPFPNAIKNTWAEFHFEKIGPTRTRVRVLGYGYVETEESRKMQEHFRTGNTWTLERLRKRFSRGPAGSE
ncbi:MAG: SRPBCC domain-containing protein [Phycisphaerales bacterium]|nr:SRPBCC domain-containing protein [Phycisphaerales bacterium]